MRQLTRHLLALSAVEGPLVYPEPFWRRTTRRFLLVTALLLLSVPCAFSLDPSLDISQYGHTSWGIREGFNVGHINAMAQTPDGYLWLGTEFGLYRFDGVRAVQWSLSGDQRFQNTYVRSLIAARNGSLWIGTYSGLASWKDGKLTQYPELSGQEVGALVEDRDGTIWAGTGYQTVVGKLCAIRASSVHCFRRRPFRQRSLFLI